MKRRSKRTWNRDEEKKKGWKKVEIQERLIERGAKRKITHGNLDDVRR